MLIYVEFDGLMLYSSALVHTQSSGSLWGSVAFGGGALFKPALPNITSVVYLHSGCNVNMTNIFGASQLSHVCH